MAADQAQAWRGFGLRQTGQLDKANSRTRDAIDIVKACEARDADAVRALTKKWWQFWL